MDIVKPQYPQSLDYQSSQALTKYLRTCDSVTVTIQVCLAILADSDCVLPRKLSFIAQLLESRLNKEANLKPVNGTKKKKTTQNGFYKEKGVWDLIFSILNNDSSRAVEARSILSSIKYLDLYNLVAQQGNPELLNAFESVLSLLLSSNSLQLPHSTNIPVVFLSTVSSLTIHFSPINWDHIYSLLNYFESREKITSNFSRDSSNKSFKDHIQFLVANFVDNGLLNSVLEDKSAHRLVKMFVETAIAPSNESPDALNFNFLQSLVSSSVSHCDASKLYRAILNHSASVCANHKSTYNTAALRKANTSFIESFLAKSSLSLPELMQANLDEAKSSNTVYLSSEYVSALYAKQFGDALSYDEVLSQPNPNIDFVLLTLLLSIEASYCRNFKDCGDKFAPLVFLAAQKQQPKCHQAVYDAVVSFYAFSSHTFLKFIELYPLVSQSNNISEHKLISAFSVLSQVQLDAVIKKCSEDLPRSLHLLVLSLKASAKLNTQTLEQLIVEFKPELCEPVYVLIEKLNSYDIGDLWSKIETVYVDRESVNDYHQLIKLRYYENFPESVPSGFVSELCKSSKMVLLALSMRYFSLLFTANESVVEKIVDTIFYNCDLNHVFANELFFESHSLNFVIVRKLINLLQSKKQISSLLKCVPIEVLDKKSKTHIINLLYDNLSVQHLDVLFHLLKYPSQSKLEKHLASIEKVVDVTQSSITRHILKAIITGHLEQHEEVTSKAYLQEVVDLFNSDLSQFTKALVCDVIFNDITKYYDYTGHFARLKAQFVQFCLQYLETINPESSNLEELRIVVRTIVSSDCKLTNLSSKGISESLKNHPDLLFLLLPKLAELDLQFSLYYLNLYMMFNTSDFDSGISTLLSQVSASHYAYLYAHILHSFAETPSPCLKLIKIFINSIKNFDSVDRKKVWVDTLTVFASIEPNREALEVIEFVTNNASIVISQHSFEKSLVILAQSASSSDNFTIVCQIVSKMLLLYRFRLKGRYHLIVKIVNCLMESLQKNHEFLEHFVRLVGNLVVPNDQSAKSLSRVAKEDALTSTIDTIKRDMKKHVGNIILKYIDLSLNSEGFGTVGETIITGAIFKVMGLYSGSDYNLLSAQMDFSSREYFKGLYERYKSGF